MVVAVGGADAVARVGGDVEPVCVLHRPSDCHELLADAEP